MTGFKDVDIQGADHDALWRVFIAVFPDDALLDALAPIDRWLDRARTHRLIRREQRHVTLAFLGDIEPVVVPALTEALRTELATVPPVVLRLESVVALPSPRAPRVIAAGFRDSKRYGSLRTAVLETVACIAPTDAIVRDLGRPGRPHITVGRTRRALLAHTPDFIHAPVLGPAAVPLIMTRLSVVRSILTARGPAYQVVARAPLGGRGDDGHTEDAPQDTH